MIAHRNPISGRTWLHPTLGPSRLLTPAEADKLADAVGAEVFTEYLLPGFGFVLTPAVCAAVGLTDTGTTPEPRLPLAELEANLYDDLA